MRPTNCNFNSPKTKTGEYVIPLVNSYGTKISYERLWPLTTTSKKTHTMGLEQRFRQNLLKERNDS